MNRYIKMFVVAAVLGTAYDFVHVHYGVLAYERPDFSARPSGSFRLSSAWRDFGGFAAQALARVVEPPLVVGRTADASLLLFAYLAGIFVAESGLVFVILAVFAAVSIATRPSKFVLIASLAGAVVGDERASRVEGGDLHYLHAQPLPLWLPLLWPSPSGFHRHGQGLKLAA